MSLSRDIHSLTDFKKKTPEFLKQLKDAGEPVVLTINGKAELVVQDSAPHQRLLDVAEEAKVFKGIRRGLEDVAAGRTQPIADAFADILRDLNQPQEARDTASRSPHPPRPTSGRGRFGSPSRRPRPRRPIRLPDSTRR